MKKLLVLFVFNISILSLIAQPGALDTAFTNNLGYLSNPGVIDAIALQGDGKIIVGGLFPFEGNYGILARINKDGTLDPDFTPDTNSNYSFNCIALQGDGKILTGITINNSQSQLSRLDGNGIVDFTFPPITIPGYYSANAITIQADGKILVGGKDTMIRFTNGGSPDTSFIVDPGLNLGVIQSIVVQPDKNILVVGDGVARLDSNGNLDNTFHPALTFTCYAIALQPDGRIIAGGLNNLVRLNSGGSLDATFDVSVLLTAGSYIQSIALQPDGKIIAGGVFLTGIGNRSNIIRLNTDGSLDPTFNAGPDFGLQVYSIVLQPDSNILAAGADYCNECTPPYMIVRLLGGNPTLSAAISGRDTICKGDTALMIALAMSDNGHVTYNWQPSNDLNCATCDSVYASPDTTTTYTLIAQDSVNTDTAYLTVYVDSSATRLTPTISISTIYAGHHDGATYCINEADSLAFEAITTNGGGHPALQWQINGQGIGVTTDTFLLMMDSTVIDPEQCTNCVLTCQMTSSLGCVRPVVVSSDSAFLVICEGINSIPLDNDITISPNPNNGTFLLSINQSSRQVNIELFNIEGQRLYVEQLRDVPSLSKEFNFNTFAKGIYLMKITTENGTVVKRVVVQ